MQIKIEELTAWDIGREVRTQRGPRVLRKGPLTEQYRAAWRSNKDAMKAVGLSMGPVNRDDPSGAWEAIWWQEPTGEQAAARAASVAASRATDAAISIPSPAGLEYMPFQRAGIAFMRNRNGVLLADQMGLGKTIQAIGVINSDETIRKILIVCPASLKLNWRNEIQKWLVRPLRVAVQNGGQPWCGEVADVVVLNYDVLDKFPQIYTTQWDMLVADEAHYVKNRQAKRTKLLLGAVKKDDRAKFPGVRARRRIFATGTPILNKPIELFPLLESLEPGKWTFMDKVRYCAGFQGKWGWDFTGHAHEEEFQRRLRETVMVRRLKSEVLTELPAKRRQIIPLPVDDCEDLVHAENQAYDRTSSEREEALADMALADASDDEEGYRQAAERLKKAQKVAFEEVSRVRHEVALAKVAGVVEHVLNTLSDTPKLVLFVHHLDVADKIKSELDAAGGVKTLVITGQTPQNERQGIVDQFNRDQDCNVLMLGIHAAGVGLSVKASMEIFAEEEWVPGIISQAEDRCHGIGRGIEGEPLQIQHLVLDGSLDSRMVKTVIRKQEVADRMLDKELAARSLAEPVTELDLDMPSEGERRATGGRQAAQAVAEVDQDLHDAVLRGMRILAGVCDGAHLRDGAGFNGCDARIGHGLAGLSRLSAKQVVLGRRVLMKYSRQLPEDINNVIRKDQ